jgi:transcription initiation factor IIE alpha subunit
MINSEPITCPQCGSEGLNYTEDNMVFISDLSEIDYPFDTTHYSFFCSECDWYIDADTSEELVKEFEKAKKSA